MMNLINPIILSKYVVNRSLDKGFTVNALKLQKLLYYIEAWHLVYFEKPLFKEEFEAWVHGPVIREVFEHYRDFRLAITLLNRMLKIMSKAIFLTNKWSLLMIHLTSMGTKLDIILNV